jgi:hypothetical protein
MGSKGRKNTKKPKADKAKSGSKTPPQGASKK